jgi:hypothetical protein
VLYEQYFLGFEKLEPTVPRKDVDRRFVILRKENIRNTALRFRFNVVWQKYNTYSMHWTRICRQIEEGTFKRHVKKAHERFGDGRKRNREKEDVSFDVDIDMDDFENMDVDTLLAEADRAAATVQRTVEDTAPPPASTPMRSSREADTAPRMVRPATLPDGAPKTKLVRKVVKTPSGSTQSEPPTSPPTPAPLSSPRLPAAGPPAGAPPASSPRLVTPAAANAPQIRHAGDGSVRGPMPGAPQIRPRMPSHPESQRMAAAPPTSERRLPLPPPSAPGLPPSQRMPAAAPAGGAPARPMIRPRQQSQPDLSADSPPAPKPLPPPPAAAPGRPRMPLPLPSQVGRDEKK